MGRIFLFFVFHFSFNVTQANVYAPSAVEVAFTYEAEFVTSDPISPAETLVDTHFSHIFGIFQSPEFVGRQGLDADLFGGVGAPRLPVEFRKIVETFSDSGRRQIQYQAKGVFLLHKKVARKWLVTGEVEVPLPYAIDRIYNEKCTDEYYNTEGDYWYFYNIYREGCIYLQDPPFAKKVLISLQERSVVEDRDPRLDWLRSDNGNGSLFHIAIVHGFDGSSTNRRDEGRRNYNQANREIQKLGFKKTVVRRDYRRPLYLFEKQWVLDNGREITVQIENLLVDTKVESKSVSFARFFKKSIEAADVVIYLGHSGLGGNLNIPSLEEKAGEFNFDNSKRQIFFFESCSSYSYYLTHFEKYKKRSQVDIVTIGLSSYFEDSTDSLMRFLSGLLDPRVRGHSWAEILGKVESGLDGGSYLINVGAIH